MDKDAAIYDKDIVRGSIILEFIYDAKLRFWRELERKQFLLYYVNILFSF